MPSKPRNALSEVSANSELGRIDAQRSDTAKELDGENPKSNQKTSRKRKSDADESTKQPKKAKAGKSAGKETGKDVLDVSGIHLDGEEARNVEIYDTCDMVRSKIKLLLKQHPSETNASLARRMKTTSNTLSNFCGKKGYDKGNTSTAFYDAYVFLEKVRIAQGKPKSKDRLKMEEVWGPEGGFDTKTTWNNKGVLLGPGEAITSKNKYGEIVITRAGGKSITGVM